MGRYDDDDEAEAPKTTRRSRRGDDEDLDKADATEAPAENVDRKRIQRGWGNAEQTKSADSPFAQRLKVTSDQQIIKFLEDDPYTSYRQHWIERQGQKSFTCISDIDPKGCPLCAAGERASARFAFNVVLLSEDGDPLIKSYEVGPRIIDQLKNFHQDPKMGPLPKHYWAVSKTGTKTTSQTNHQMVKESDLADDWEMDPLTDKEIADFKKHAYDASIVSIPTHKTLKGIAQEELSG